MSTENELDIIQNLDTNETKEEIKNEEIPVQEQPIEPPKIEDEKPKRAGRKKRDLTDVKIENSNSDNAMDTQPLFEQPVIVEGKRSRKPTSRLELSDLATPKKELSIPQVKNEIQWGVHVHTYFSYNLSFNLVYPGSWKTIG
jgi:hypothetical protein